jgi:hypothetical protein
MLKKTTFPLPKTKSTSLTSLKKIHSNKNESDEEDAEGDRSNRTRVSGYFFDHLSGAIRRAFNQRSINK